MTEVVPPNGLERVQLLELARFGLLRPFLRQRLIAKAIAEISLSDEERQQCLQQFAQEHQLRDGRDLERYAQTNLLGQQAMEELIERPMKLERHCNEKFRPKAEARFLDRKTQLDRVVYSLLRLEDQGLARELYLQIEEGEASFAELAAAHAEGPERATHGIVGPVPLTQAHPLLADRLRTATPGVVMEPFRIEKWWLVVRMESLTPATFDDSTATQMTQELFEQWLEEEVDREIGDLRSQVFVATQPAPEETLAR